MRATFLSLDFYSLSCRGCSFPGCNGTGNTNGKSKLHKSWVLLKKVIFSNLFQTILRCYKNQSTRAVIVPDLILSFLILKSCWNFWSEGKCGSFPFVVDNQACDAPGLGLGAPSHRISDFTMEVPFAKAKWPCPFKFEISSLYDKIYWHKLLGSDYYEYLIFKGQTDQD